MSIPYVKHHVTPEDEAAVLRVFRSGYLTQGPEVELFEEELAAFAGAKYAVAVNSGTAALHLAYLAVGAATREVLMPAISFVATANAALHAGATPRFADTEPNGIVGGRQVVMGNGTQPILSAVTLSGEPMEFEHRIPVNTVLDACHGPLRLPVGASAACFSFHPAKHVAAGEGGAIVTNDATIAERCRLLRSHGRAPLLWDSGHMVMDELGFNYRLPEMGAALARSQLTRVMAGVQQRREIAALYDAAFQGIVTVEPRSPDSWLHLYRLRHPDRDAFRKRLASRGVGTAVHYPVIPLQPYYRQRFGYEPGMWPNAEKYAAETVSIPMFPTLTGPEIETVIQAVKECA